MPSIYHMLGSSKSEIKRWKDLIDHVIHISSLCRKSEAEAHKKMT